MNLPNMSQHEPAVWLRMRGRQGRVAVEEGKDCLLTLCFAYSYDDELYQIRSSGCGNVS